MSRNEVNRLLHPYRFLAILPRLLLTIILGLMMALALALAFSELRAQWHDGPHAISSVTHEMPEVDFSLLWSAGKMVAAGKGALLYDGPSFALWRQHLFGAGLQRLDWLYPPPMVAVGIAVSQIPLIPGYFLWMLVVFGVSVLVLRGAGLSWQVVIFGLLGPPMWRGLAIGQYAPLAGALVVAGLLTARRAPVRAGIALAFATLKPHLGILVPIVWVAQRRRTAFCVAAVGTVGLAAVSTASLGPGIWPAFLHGSATSARMLVETPTPTGYPLNAASVFWMARSFGASVALSYAVQAIAAIFAVFAVWKAARHGTEAETATAAVAICMILLVPPYLYASDLVGYSIVIAMIAEQQSAGPLPIFLWLCPGVSEVFTYVTGKAVLPVAFVVTALVAWRQFRASVSSAIKGPIAAPATPVTLFGQTVGEGSAPARHEG